MKTIVTRSMRAHLVLPVIVVIGCGVGDPQSEFGSNWLDTVRDPNASTDIRLNAALTGIDIDPCAGTADSCEMASYSLAPAAPAGRAERVLIIDELRPSVDMLRFGHRIAGVYEVTSDATIVPMATEWFLPRTFGDILTAFAHPGAPDAETLAALHEPLADAFGAKVPTGGSHGLAVHWILTDLIASREVILLDYRYLSFHAARPELVCSVGQSPTTEGFVALRNYASDAAAALQRFMREQGVALVNASWGFTVESIRGPWARVCGTNAPSRAVMLDILAAYEPMFEVLFGTSEVLTVHAALQSVRPEDGPFDRPGPQYFNRLRVGSFGHRGDSVPPDGLSVAPSGSRPQPVDDSYADVYINSGCEDEDCRSTAHLSISGPYGFGRRPFALTQSSFVAPLLTRSLVKRRQSPPFSDRPWNDELIEDLMNVVRDSCAGPPCYRDPLLHMD